MMFLQFIMMMYRNLSFQDSPCLLYDVSDNVLNDNRKMFNANYFYLLVIVSGTGGPFWHFTAQLSFAQCYYRSINRTIDNNQKSLLTKWQYHTSAN